MKEITYCKYCMAPLKNGESCSCGYNSANYLPAPHQLVPGSVLQERYLVGRVLGEGGFGITYVGRDLKLGLKIAIKEYYPAGCASRTSGLSRDVYPTYSSQESFERGKEKFLREAKTMGMLDRQPHIVGVKDFFEENNTAYIVMEYVEGTTLKALTAERGGRIQATELLEMMKPMFKALSTMHETGLIHRDISPDNLMLENGSLKLLDFGCAKDISEGSETQTITLKHGYAPLEQYQRSGQGPWTDVYALAASIYYCLTGVTPPRATDRITDDEIVSPNKYGAGLTFSQERALMKALSVRSRDRYQSVDAFASALYNEKPADKPKKSGSSKLVPVLIVLIGLILAGMVIAVWVNISGDSDKDDRGNNSVTTTVAATTKASTTTKTPTVTTAPTTTEKPTTTTPEVTVGSSNILDNSLLQSEDYYDKTEITKIYFRTTLRLAPSDAWDFSAEGDGSVLAWLDGTKLYIAGNGSIKASADASKMFNGYTALESINFGNFDTSNVTDMSYMFYNCTSLTSLDLSGFDTSKVTTMVAMFTGCSYLASIDVSSFKTSKVENMATMFGGCDIVTIDLSSFDTSNVTSMSGMFCYCSKLTTLDLSNFDTSKVTNMSNMFISCYRLEELILPDDFGSNAIYTGSMYAGTKFEASAVLDNSLLQSEKYYNKSDITEITFLESLSSAPSSAWDFSLEGDGSVLAWVTNNHLYIAGDGGVVADESCKHMFYKYESVTKIDVSCLDTSNVTNMSGMFGICGDLIEIVGLNDLDTSNVTDMSYMFVDCFDMTSLDLTGFDTSKVTDMYEMFYASWSLTEINVSSFDTSNVVNMGRMFSWCEDLTSLDISNFDTSKVEDMSHMFDYCKALKTLVVSKDFFVNDPDTTEMFDDCPISQPTSYK